MVWLTLPACSLLEENDAQSNAEKLRFSHDFSTGNKNRLVGVDFTPNQPHSFSVIAKWIRFLFLYLSYDFEDYPRRGWIWAADEFCCSSLRIDFFLVWSSFVSPWKRASTLKNPNKYVCSVQQPWTHNPPVLRILQFVSSLVMLAAAFKYLKVNCIDLDTLTLRSHVITQNLI